MSLPVIVIIDTSIDCIGFEDDESNCGACNFQNGFCNWQPVSDPESTLAWAFFVNPDMDHHRFVALTANKVPGTKQKSRHATLRSQEGKYRFKRASHTCRMT